MDDLTITSQGHLLVQETDLATETRRAPRAVVEAFRESAVRGMLRLATVDPDAVLPLSFEFARSVGRLYLTGLCKVALDRPGEPIPELEPPIAALEALVQQAPPMVGLEYLTLDTLLDWWSALDVLIQREVAVLPGGLAEYLRQRDPRWRYVGRVTLHLAENKRDPEYPFAFLATYANGLTPQGKVKHEPLGRALQQYAGAQNRDAMLGLLLPLSKAAESSELIHDLVDSGDIYHPLAWAATEAYAFLQTIPQCEASGLIVRVPDWWNAQKPTRPRVNVKVDSKNRSGLTADDMLQFTVGMSLEDEELSPAEVAELLESSGGLVPLKGKWVEVDRDKLQEALKHWKQVEKDVRREGITFFAGMRLLSGANLAPDGSADTEEEIRQWTGLTAGPRLDAILKSLRSPEIERETVPPNLKADLRPYQRTGFGWLRFVVRLGLGACLADDMGLGKTVQVISLLLDLKQTKPTTPSLLVVPASLIANWKGEMTRFAPSLTFGVAHPSERNAAQKEMGADQARGLDLVVTTYGMLTRTEWIKQFDWRLVILDEAQAIKNSGTKQSRAVKELRAGSRIAMTGTPIENRLSDLWSLFDFLNPGLLGTAKQFGSFVKRLQNVEPPSFEPLRSLVRPYILRRLKTDKSVIADLPDKTEVKAYCPLSKYQAALYQHAVATLAEQLKEADGMQRRGIVLAYLMRFKQICNHPAQVAGTHDYAADRSGKFQRLAAIVEEIAARQEKVLVFTQFREITAPLADHLASLFGRPGLILHGGTSVKQRQAFVDQFQREDGPPFFVLSLKAGGTGLNLTAASHVIHFDRWWNPAIENQATDRAFRIGQKKNVLVHKFVCRGTVEEKIDEMIAEKTQVAGEIFGPTDSGETLLTELDDKRLLDFVRLDLARATDF